MNHPLIVTTNYLASDSELIVVGISSIPQLYAAISYGGYSWQTSMDSTYGQLVYGSGIAWNGSMWCLTFKTEEQDIERFRIVISSNGKYNSWTTIGGELKTPNADAYAAASDGIRWVVVGANSNSSVLAVSFLSDYELLHIDNYDTVTVLTNTMPEMVAKAVAWNGYYWCIVGDNRFTRLIATSPNGLRWITKYETNNILTEINGIAWNGSIWATVGRGASPSFDSLGQIGTSINGNHWSYSHNTIFQNIYGIAWSGSNWGIVGVSFGNFISVAISSGETLNFTATSSNPFPGGIGYGITWTGSLWAVSGYDSDRSATVAVSKDGNSWTRAQPFPNGTGYGIASKFTKYLIPTIESQAPTFIAVGSNASQTESISRSLNGTNWYSASNNPFLDGVGYGIAYNSSNLWVAVGKNSDGSVTAASSSNGSFWVPSINNPFPGGVGNGIAYNGSNLWVAVGANATNTICISTSTNGSNWITSENPFPGGIGYGIGWNGVYWCAVGNTPSGIIAAKSSNASVWTSTVISQGIIYGIAWNGEYWWAVGNRSFISENAVTWRPTADPFGSSGTAYGIAWNGSYWCIVGTDSSGSISAVVTRNPIDIFLSSRPFLIFGTGYGISWNGYFWCAVGKNSYTLTFSKSIDGFSWEIANNGFTEGSSYGIASRFTDYLLPRPRVPLIEVNSISSGNGEVFVYYTVLNTGGNPINKFKYAIYSGDYFDLPIQNPLIISGILANTNYTFNIKATNDVGDSQASSFSLLTAANPGPPTITSISYVSPSATVNFSASLSDGGAAIQGYYYSTDNINFIGVTTGQFSFVIKAGTNVLPYTVYMKARNVAQFDSIVINKDYTNPGVAKSVLVTRGLTTATVSWSPPETDGGAEVNFYKVQQVTESPGYPDSTADVYQGPYPGSGSFTKTINPNVTYRFVVIPRNSAGLFGSPTSSLPVILANPPDVVRNLNVRAGSRTLAVSFSAPDFTGYSDIEGYSYSINNAAYVDITDEPPFIFTLNNLDNEVEYTVRIRAFNGTYYSQPATASARPTLYTFAVNRVNDTRIYPGYTQYIAAYYGDYITLPDAITNVVYYKVYIIQIQSINYASTNVELVNGGDVYADGQPLPQPEVIVNDYPRTAQAGDYSQKLYPSSNPSKTFLFGIPNADELSIVTTYIRYRLNAYDSYDAIVGVTQEFNVEVGDTYALKQD